nr:ribose-phosphate diphosphokinase [Microvirga terricola]
MDFAPQPRDSSLSRLLTYWIERRKNVIAPKPAEIAVSDLGDDGANAFIFRFAPHGDDLSLIFGGATLESLVGPCDPGAIILTDASERREAVRLRRLANLVRERAEPVLAEFVISRRDGTRASVEIVVAPLASDGRTVDGLFGGVALHHIEAPLHAPHEFRLAPPRHGQLLFALSSATAMGEHIARHLGAPLQRHEEREFEDGEHKARPLVDVRGSEAFVTAGLHGGDGQSVNDRLCRLLFFIGALKESGASRVTVLAPYLCYARKDRQTKPFDPVTTRYVAQLFEAVGTDRLITMEVHNLAAFQNAFRCDTEHLVANEVLAAHIVQTTRGAPMAVVSPDIGGAKRAETFRQDLEKLSGHSVSKALSDKQRSMGQLSGDLFVGNVADRVAIILDDLISTGATMARVAAQCRNHGARKVIVAATHGVGGMSLIDNLTQPTIDHVVLTNTIPQPSVLVSTLADRLTVLDVSAIFAQSIRR